MQPVKTNSNWHNFFYLDLSIGVAYYLAVKRFNLLSNSSLKIQMIAFSASSVMQLLRLRHESMFLKRKILSQICTFLPCVLNGATSCLSKLPWKLTLLNTGILGGSQIFQVLIIQQQKKEVINHITKELNTIFSEKTVNIYTHILQETHDINAQYEGWTLLHYCTYMFSYTVRATPSSLLPFYEDLGVPAPNAEENGRRLLDLMEYILNHGADIEKVDDNGRTPIYFASTLYASQAELNERYWKILSANTQWLVPQNKSVQPLHTVASLSQKFVIDLIEKGAKTDAIDMYERMPLHCAVINSRFDEEFNNVKALIYYEPKSIEHEDIFGNFPLYYAAVFGSDDLFNLMLQHSSRRVISSVLEKLEGAEFPEDNEHLRQLEESFKIYDSIYNVPARFKIIFGGMPPKRKKKQHVVQQLSKTKENKKTTYQDYDTYHDGHGWKHVMNARVYKQKFSDTREFAKSTKNGNSAKFFPDFGQNYEFLVEKCVKSWVDKGADQNHLYVDFSVEVGADNGSLTKTVEIYFTASGGTHIRPKHL